jgi:hypothetical protein
LTLQSARDERLEIPIGLLSDKDQAALMMLIDGLPLAAPRVELAKMAALQRRTRVRRVAVMAGTVVVLVILLEVLSWNR